MTETPKTACFCGRPALARGYCTAHYARVRRHGDPGPADIRYPTHPASNYGAECTIEGCHDLARARGLCTKHYGRLRRNGDPLKVLRIRP